MATPDIFKTLYNARAQLPLLYDSEQLYAIHPNIFQYSSPEQLAVYKRQLQLAYIAISVQRKMDKADQRKHLLKKHEKKLKHCENLWKRIKLLEAKEDKISYISMLSEMPLKYLGMKELAPWLVKKMNQLAGVSKEDLQGEKKSEKNLNVQNITDPQKKQDSKKRYAITAIIKEWIGEINAKRLYWIWGSGIISNILARLPDDVFKQESIHKLAIPSPISGYMSWLLYYTRLGINLFLLLKHTIGVTPGEKTLRWQDRFKTQWEQRKFILLNDAAWATLNLVSFFWLAGSGRAGYAGSILTGKFLLMDLALVYWRYEEERTGHNSKILAIEENIQKLREEQNKKQEELDKLRKKLLEETAGFDNPEKQKLENEIATLKATIDQQKRLKEQTELAWKYKYRSLAVDMVAAAGIVAGYSMLCCFFLPAGVIVPATAIIIGLVGAAMCFAINVASTSINAGLQISKRLETKKLRQQEEKALLEAFCKTSNEVEQKRIFLELKGLQHVGAHHQQLINFEIKKLLRAIFIDVLLPTVTIVAFVFMPMPIIIGMTVAGFALALLTWWPLREEPLISGMKASLDPNVDQASLNLGMDKDLENEFQTFKDNTLNEHEQRLSASKGNRFFSEEKKRLLEDDNNVVLPANKRGYA